MKRAIYIGDFYGAIGITGTWENNTFTPDDTGLDGNLPVVASEIYFPHDCNDWVDNTEADKGMI